MAGNYNDMCAALAVIVGFLSCMFVLFGMCKIHEDHTSVIVIAPFFDVSDYTCYELKEFIDDRIVTVSGIAQSLSEATREPGCPIDAKEMHQCDFETYQGRRISSALLGCVVFAVDDDPEPLTALFNDAMRAEKDALFVSDPTCDDLRNLLPLQNMTQHDLKYVTMSLCGDGWYGHTCKKRLYEKPRCLVDPTRYPFYIRGPGAISASEVWIAIDDAEIIDMEYGNPTTLELVEVPGGELGHIE